IENGIHLKKEGKPVRFLNFDFTNYPDLVQTVVVTCAIKKVPFKITGAESLKIKETDRILALQNELRKFGIEIKETSNGVIEWDGKINDFQLKQIEIDTYDDHRMAMAFAPVALINQSIKIKNPNVVVKSYPNYWTDLKKVGFEITEK
ncbi:MAG: 3-phosphoshikimate 1-carboxyvinyltransferase, partial [Bacteroidales bacterium]|nr:3-phosphoshikimate 1-carboxyvinyltransferase [Bacteroidales bacterium]